MVFLVSIGGAKARVNAARESAQRDHDMGRVPRPTAEASVAARAGKRERRAERIR